MKSFRLLIAALALCVSAMAQQPSVSQSWTEGITPAPPTVLNSQSASTPAATGTQLSPTGGTIAPGAYRLCVTFFTSTNTETPCSTDTAATSVVTTTGSTSVLTVQSPVLPSAGSIYSNVIGYRVYVGANAGATAAETLQTLNATVCTLSASTTPSCALGNPATFVSSTNFSAGSGGPATPGTAVFPPIANQANQALFENALYTYHVVYWVVSGTAPSACTFNIQSGATIAALANVGQTITCTSSGGYSLPLNTTYNYTSINLATYTAGSTTTQVTFYETSYLYPPFGPLYFGNAVPTGACQTGLYQVTAATSAYYSCNAGTWTAVTLP